MILPLSNKTSKFRIIDNVFNTIVALRVKLLNSKPLRSGRELCHPKWVGNFYLEIVQQGSQTFQPPTILLTHFSCEFKAFSYNN